MAAIALPVRRSRSSARRRQAPHMPTPSAGPYALRSVSASIVPIVKASVGTPIDVVVARAEVGAEPRHLGLSLTPKAWSGAGLLGCTLK